MKLSEAHKRHHEQGKKKKKKVEMLLDYFERDSHMFVFLLFLLPLIFLLREKFLEKRHSSEKLALRCF